MPHTTPSMAAEYRPRFEFRFLLPHYWPSWFLVGMVACTLCWPERIKKALAHWLARRVLGRHRKRRHIVDINLACCFPDKTAQQRTAMADAYFYYAARVLLDYGLLWFARAHRLDKQIEIRGVENLSQSLANKKRTILLTCHSLGLEYGALAITRNYSTVGLVKPARNELFEWLIARGRSRFQGRLFERDAGIRNIVRAIKNGLLFYYLPDEDLGRTQQTEFLPFFDVPTATLTSLGRLAHMCDAQVVPCFTWLDESVGKYVLEFYPALEDFPGADEVADAGRMNQVLEKMICVAPEQYMWSFRIFQTRPASAPSLYE